MQLGAFLLIVQNLTMIHEGLVSLLPTAVFVAWVCFGKTDSSAGSLAQTKRKYNN